MAGDVFAALGDPTRRHLFGQLATRGPMTATALASDLAISRQAVAKHLGILTDAGMATSTKRGRETHYVARTESLSSVETWMQQVQGAWEQRLGALAAAVEKPSD